MHIELSEAQVERIADMLRDESKKVRNGTILVDDPQGELDFLTEILRDLGEDL